MNTFRLKVGETGAELRVTFGGRTEGISDATGVTLRYKAGSTVVSRQMTIESDTVATYEFTDEDFTILNAPMVVICDFKVETPDGIFYFPKPGNDKIKVEDPLVP
jgi:hypothetical protein